MLVPPFPPRPVSTPCRFLCPPCLFHPCCRIASHCCFAFLALHPCPPLQLHSSLSLCRNSHLVCDPGDSSIFNCSFSISNGLPPHPFPIRYLSLSTAASNPTCIEWSSRRRPSSRSLFSDSSTSTVLTISSLFPTHPRPVCCRVVFPLIFPPIIHRSSFQKTPPLSVNSRRSKGYARPATSENDRTRR